MPKFQISVVNETFSSSNEHEGASVDDATAQAIRAALEIGADEVASGKQFFAAEVKIGSVNETIRRYVVSVGASPLQITE